MSQKLTPEQIMAVLEEQAREDAAVEAEIQAVASLTDAQLDEELRRAGLDPAGLESQAEALFREAQAQPPVPAVAQEMPRALAERPRRRRPAAVAVWLAAGAAAATAGGALLYSLAHRQPEEHPVPEPSTPVPAPSSSAAPLPPNLVSATPSELRAAAATALDQGRPRECLRLLDAAKEQDPAGDTAPAIKALRDRATSALSPKPPKP